jgi:hypothetical protein
MLSSSHLGLGKRAAPHRNFFTRCRTNTVTHYREGRQQNFRSQPTSARTLHPILLSTPHIPQPHISYMKKNATPPPMQIEAHLGEPLPPWALPPPRPWACMTTAALLRSKKALTPTSGILSFFPGLTAICLWFFSWWCPSCSNVGKHMSRICGVRSTLPDIVLMLY